MNSPKIIFVCVLLSLIAGVLGWHGDLHRRKECRRGETAESATKPGAPATAPISAEAAQKAGIEIATAGPARIRTTLVLYGSIKPNAEREQDVRARYPGVVRSVDKRTGDAVKQGDVLLTVESSESLQVYSIRAPLTGQVLARSVNPGDAVDSSTVLMKVADLSTLWAEFAVFARDLGHVRPGMTRALPRAG